MLPQVTGVGLLRLDVLAVGLAGYAKKQDAIAGARDGNVPIYLIDIKFFLSYDLLHYKGDSCMKTRSNSFGPFLEAFAAASAGYDLRVPENDSTSVFLAVMAGQKMEHVKTTADDFGTFLRTINACKKPHSGHC